MKRIVKQTRKAIDHKIGKYVEPIIICCFILIVSLMPLHAFLSTWGGTAIGPLLVWKSWKEILLIAIIPLVLTYLFSRPDIFKTLWSRIYNKLIAIYFLLHLTLVIFSQASNQAVIAGLIMNLRFFAMFLVAQLIMSSKCPWVNKIKEILPKWLLKVAIGLSILAILQVTMLPKDFLSNFGYIKGTTIAPYTLLDDNQDALRAFATMRGPNTLASYLLIPMAFAVYFIIKRQNLILSLSSLSLSLIALILTGSRSAWVGFMLTLITLAIIALPKETIKKWVKLSIIPATALAAIFIWSSINIPALRLAIFHSSPEDSHLLEGSTEDHWSATTQGISNIIANPLGTGPGSAGPASYYDQQDIPSISENYFVQIGEEVGVAGLILFIAINLIIAIKLYRQKSAVAHILLASFIGITAINIFLHGWADDPTSITWWGLAGLFIADKVDKRDNKK